MKTIIGAVALLIAAPAVAQTAPATNPQAGHSQHQHQGKHGEGNGEHKGECCKDGKHRDCCKKAEQQQGQKMNCCDKGAASGDHKGHGAH